mmetsp:Transcript_14646/g.58546  ORF Transcript_14646/g.58546 Transcript_14646/m.58546 type:complete len:314 (-) Transcript_14646:867-1808(-)
MLTRWRGHTTSRTDSSLVNTNGEKTQPTTLIRRCCGTPAGRGETGEPFETNEIPVPTRLSRRRLEPDDLLGDARRHARAEFDDGGGEVGEGLGRLGGELAHGVEDVDVAEVGAQRAERRRVAHDEHRVDRGLDVQDGRLEPRHEVVVRPGGGVALRERERERARDVRPRGRGLAAVAAVAERGALPLEPGARRRGAAGVVGREGGADGVVERVGDEERVERRGVRDVREPRRVGVAHAPRGFNGERHGRGEHEEARGRALEAARVAVPLEEEVDDAIDAVRGVGVRRLGRLLGGLVVRRDAATRLRGGRRRRR